MNAALVLVGSEEHEDAKRLWRHDLVPSRRALREARTRNMPALAWAHRVTDAVLDGGEASVSPGPIHVVWGGTWRAGLCGVRISATTHWLAQWHRKPNARTTYQLCPECRAALRVRLEAK